MEGETAEDGEKPAQAEGEEGAPTAEGWPLHMLLHLHLIFSVYFFILDEVNFYVL